MNSLCFQIMNKNTNQGMSFIYLEFSDKSKAFSIFNKPPKLLTPFKRKCWTKKMEKIV